MILRQDEPSCLSRHPIHLARSRWGVYRESGLVHGGKAAVRGESVQVAIESGYLITQLSRTKPVYLDAR
jgi:hypothetical protein